MKPSLILLIVVLILFQVIPNFKFHPLIGLLLLIAVGWVLVFLFTNIDDKSKEE